MEVVRLEGVSKSFGDLRVFSNLTLSFEGGLVYGVIAPNGYGKTTLLKLILGILRPDSGRVVVRARRISYLPQDSEPIGVMTVMDFVISYLTLRGYGLRRARERAVELLRAFGVYEYRDKAVDELSGGQRQRVLLSAVLGYDAELYLLDEPLTHLDIEGTALLKGIVRKLREGGNTVIISSPTASGIIDVLDRVLIITRGKRFVEFDPQGLIREAESKVVVEGDRVPEGCYWVYERNYLCERELVDASLYDSVRRATVDDVVAKVVFHE